MTHVVTAASISNRLFSAISHISIPVLVSISAWTEPAGPPGLSDVNSAWYPAQFLCSFPPCYVLLSCEFVADCKVQLLHLEQAQLAYYDGGNNSFCYFPTSCVYLVRRNLPVQENFSCVFVLFLHMFVLTALVLPTLWSSQP